MPYISIYTYLPSRVYSVFSFCIVERGFALFALNLMWNLSFSGESWKRPMKWYFQNQSSQTTPLIAEQFPILNCDPYYRTICCFWIHWLSGMSISIHYATKLSFAKNMSNSRVQKWWFLGKNSWFTKWVSLESYW